MKNIFAGILLALMTCASTFAQQASLTINVTTQPDNQPLPGANVMLVELDKGTITDFDGVARYNDLPYGEYTVNVTYVGFQAKEMKVGFFGESQITATLKPAENELDAVVLQSIRSTRTIRNTPTRVEFIGQEELKEKTAMNSTNIAMVLRESTGIQMQQTSLSSGNMNIRIQGLDGRYTQLLKDGFPLYGGFSGGLSIMQIPPLDLAQFEIIKGSSSTLYGGGAIAGLVNMVSKRPQEEPELDIMLAQTHALGSTVNTFYSEKYGKTGLTLYASGNYQKQYDPEDDGFSNLPKTYTASFNPKFFYYPSEKTTVWVGLNGTYDNRLGGDMNYIENGFSGEHQYFEENISKRVSSQAVYETSWGKNKKLQVKNSIGFFDRRLSTPSDGLIGQQWNTFSEVNYSFASAKADWIMGANLYTSAFDEQQNVLDRDQENVTLGAFSNANFDLAQKLVLETGLRTDYSPQWGFFPLPRLSLLYKIAPGLSSRIGGGLGYKIPDMFTEEAENINYAGILPLDENSLKAERSYGGNLDLNYSTWLSDDLKLSVNQLFYLTAIRKGLLLNAIGEETFEFVNADGDILSKGSETNVKFSYKDFRWFLNYAFIDTRLQYLPGNPLKPLTARHNAGSVIMYESPRWRLGFETYYTGKQKLSNGNDTHDYFLLGLLAMHNFKWGSAYVNFENMTDRRQSRFSPLVLPPHDNPEFPDIYAPTDGFILSAGIIIKPFGNALD